MFDTLEILYPPQAINKFYYRCDKSYILDSYQEIVKLSLEKESYSIVVTSATLTLFYSYKGPNFCSLLARNKKFVHGKHKTGGQSAQRFDRLHEDQLDSHAKAIVEKMIELYMSNGQFNSHGLIILGPSTFKRRVMDSLSFKCFTKHLLGVITTEEVGESLIRSHETDIAACLLQKERFEVNDLLNNTIYENRLAFGSEIDDHFDEMEIIYVSEKYSEMAENNEKIKVVNCKSFESYGRIGVRYYPLIEYFE